MDFGQLVTDCRKNNAAAQKCLFDEFSGAMLLICMRYVRKREDAEELMLGGFYKFFTHMGRFNYTGKGSIKAWLSRIMINECLMFLRKHNAIYMTVEVEEYMATEAEMATGGLSAAELFQLVLNLPVGYRTVFNMYVIDGMRHKEIAAALGITQGASKSQLSKARALLQQLINKNNNYEQQQAR